MFRFPWLILRTAKRNVMSKFQYVSDLHLDLRKNGNTAHTWEKLLPPVAPRLILAGDVAELGWKGYLPFLKHCSQRFKDVFITPGNHEFYGTSVTQGDSLLQTWAKEVPNLRVLQHSHFLLDKETDTVSPFVAPEKTPNNAVHILGCTMWSNLPPHAVKVCSLTMNDFYRIDGMTPRLYQFLHEQDVKWLKKEIFMLCPTSPALLVTHHAPLARGVSHPKYETEGRTLNHAFCTDLSDTIGTLPPDSWWVYGHTHWRTRFREKGIWVTSNALGYPGEEAAFDQDFGTQTLIL